MMLAHIQNMSPEQRTQLATAIGVTPDQLNQVCVCEIVAMDMMWVARVNRTHWVPLDASCRWRKPWRRCHRRCLPR